jgi:hypothetical protein
LPERASARSHDRAIGATRPIPAAPWRDRGAICVFIVAVLKIRALLRRCAHAVERRAQQTLYVSHSVAARFQEVFNEKED